MFQLLSVYLRKQDKSWMTGLHILCLLFIIIKYMNDWRVLDFGHYSLIYSLYLSLALNNDLSNSFLTICKELLFLNDEYLIYARDGHACGGKETFFVDRTFHSNIVKLSNCYTFYLNSNVVQAFLV